VAVGTDPVPFEAGVEPTVEQVTAIVPAAVLLVNTVFDEVAV
jgi:hypothetical protein